VRQVYDIHATTHCKERKILQDGQFIRAILDKKPDVTIEDNRRLTALHYAVAMHMGRYVR
jgi:hypothetical protein